MPPRVVKRGAASAGPKRTPRTTRGTLRKHVPKQQEVPEESVKGTDDVVDVEAEEEVMVVEKPVVEEEPVVEDKPVVVDKQPISVDNGEVEQLPDVKWDPNQLVQQKNEEVNNEYDEKDEPFNMDGNEPQEHGGDDHDEKDSDQDVVQEVVVDGREGCLDNVSEEEEGYRYTVEDNMEDVHEELEEEEVNQQVGEQENVRLGDTEEEQRHELVQERRKRKEFEVFVGGLDNDATEEDLRKVFSAVGEVAEVRLMMNPLTKKNKGFAFLRFATVEQAKRAVIELKNPVINGKQCGVTPSQDSDTLFLGNICRTWTKEALKEKLKHYGVENVEDVTLVEDSNSKGLNRGFAFLEFSSRSDAMGAFKRLQKRDVVFGVDRPAKVSFADSFIDPDDEIMAQVKTVFIDGLHVSWDEKRMNELLRGYGEIEKIELARNMPSARRKDYGFVTFNTHDAAVTCAEGINNAELGEGDKKAKVRARLSRPLQRGKGKNVSRGDFWSAQGAGRYVRGSYGRPVPQSQPMQGIRGAGSRIPSASVKRSIGVRDRRPIMSTHDRGRPLVPLARSYDRGPPVPSYAKNSLKRGYSRREELHPPRGRVTADYDSRALPEKHLSYREDFSSRHHGYVDDGYGRSFERPSPIYREGRGGHYYESISGSKRPYSSLENASYADAGPPQSRERLDYEYGGGGASHYGDAYGDRFRRSNLGYGGSGRSMSDHDLHELYGSRQGMEYGGGSFGSSDVGGMYSSSYRGDYVSRGNDVGGSSYSSMYPGRGTGGSSYMGGGGSGSGSYY